MKVITYDRFKPGVTMEQIRPLLPEETAHAWRLWKQGIIRENYAIADRPGVVIVFEVKDAKEAQRYLDDFPMTKAGFLEWFTIPVTAPCLWKACLMRRLSAGSPCPTPELEGAASSAPP